MRGENRGLVARGQPGYVQTNPFPVEFPGEEQSTSVIFRGYRRLAQKKYHTLQVYRVRAVRT